MISEVRISKESLRKIVKWIKLHGIKSSSPRSIVSGINDLYPLFSVTKLKLQHKIETYDGEEEDNDANGYMQTQILRSFYAMMFSH